MGPAVGGQWLGIGTLLSFLQETDVKISAKVELHRHKKEGGIQVLHSGLERICSIGQLHGSICRCMQTLDQPKGLRTFCVWCASEKVK